jgi:hypothetical protein
MRYLVSSAMQRLEAIRDLKAAGFGASAPVEDDTDHRGDDVYTLEITDFPPGEAARIEDILHDVDPGATRADRLR